MGFAGREDRSDQMHGISQSVKSPSYKVQKKYSHEARARDEGNGFLNLSKTMHRMHGKNE